MRTNFPPGFLETFVDKMANDRQNRMRGMSDEAAMQHVKNVVAANQIVIGVWQDATIPSGVGMHIIKGNRTLSAIIASGVPERTDFAVPCPNYEQALAAEKVLGDGRPEAQQ